jgi:hypothetical protein
MRFLGKGLVLLSHLNDSPSADGPKLLPITLSRTDLPRPIVSLLEARCLG